MADKNVSSNVVIRINDKEVTNSFKGISQEVAKLEKELRGTIRGTDEWAKKFKEVEEAKKHLEAVRKEIGYTKKSIDEVASSGTSLKTIFTGNVAADFFMNAVNTAKEFGYQLKERITELVEIKRNLALLDSDLKGAALDKAAVSVKSISTTYSKGIEEIQLAVKGLNAQTGDTNKSLDLIKKGFEAGADASGEMLQQLKEYPTMMKDARVSAEEMIAIMSASEKMGVYDDKGIDAIKEGMLRVREGTKATQDAMKALGIDTESVYAKIKAGTMTYFDVIKMVSNKLKEVGADSRITGTAIADIFGGPGEDASYEYLSNLGKINANLNELTESTDVNVIAKKEELEANEKLNSVWVQLTGTASTLNRWYSSLKSGMADLLSATFGIKEAKLSDEYYNQEIRLRYLKTQLDQNNVSEKKKLEIFQALKSEFPQYFSGLDLEKMKHDEITKAINRSIDALGRKYKAQVFQEKFDETSADFKSKYSDAMEAEKDGQKLIGEIQKKYKSLENFKFKSGTTVNQLRELDVAIGDILKKERESSTITDKAFWSQDNHLQRSARALSIRLANANKISTVADEQRQKDEAILNKMKANQLPDVFDTSKPTPGSNADANLTGGKAPKPKKDNSDDKRKKELEAIEKAEADSHKKMLELQSQYQSAKTDIIDEAFQKETQKEVDRRNEEDRKIKQEIKDLEERKKNSKSDTEKKDIDTSVDLLNKINEQKEEAHRFKMLEIQTKYDGELFQKMVEASQKKIDEQRRLDEEEIIGINSLSEAKKLLKDNEYLQLTDTELNNIRTLEDAKNALREAADRAMLKQQEEAIKKQIDNLTEALNDPALSEDARQKLAENLDFLKDKITQVKSAIKGGEEADAKKVQEETKESLGKIDILGFSAADWEETFKNIGSLQDALNATRMIIGAMGNAFSMFSQLQKNLSDRELANYVKNQNKKKTLLETQLAEGWITNEEYNKSVQKIEAETARKKAEINYKQAKAEKTAKIASAVANTALGIIQAWSNPGYPMAIPLSIIIGALGAVQIATIASQPLPDVPSYADGGYFEGFTGESNLPADETGERPIGLVKLHRKEWVAPRWMTESPRFADTFDYLESVRSGKKSSMAEGGFVDTQNPEPKKQNQENAFQNDSQLAYAFIQFVAIVKDIQDNGLNVEAYFADNIDNMKGLSRMNEKYNSTLNRNKHK